MFNFAIGPLDLLIIVAYVLGLVLFGMWLGRGQRDLSDYLLGSRSLPWWAVLGSIVATETSTVTFLSVPGLSFKSPDGDLRFLQLSLGYILGRTLIVFLFLPAYFRGELFSAYQVLHERFGGATKRVASLLFLVTRTLADGLRLFLSAVVLQQVVGVSMEQAILFMGLATILYTFCGGMKSVVWSDCIQLVIYLGGAILAGVLILNELPGDPEDWWTWTRAQDKWRIWDFSFDLTRPYTFWSGLIGGMFLSLATHGADQLMVQRYLCARSQREAARALFVSGWVVALQFALFLSLGVALSLYFHSYPPSEPLAPDQAFARFIVFGLPAGAVGVVIAAVLSAAMSTLSSSLNSSATAVMSDFGLRGKGAAADRDRREVRLGRGLTIGFGGLQIAVAMVGRYLEKSVVDSVLSIAGFTTGIVLGVFFLGVLTRRVTQAAALWGLSTGLLVMTGVAFGTRLAWPWYPVVGSSVTFAAGNLAQWIYFRREGARTKPS